MTRIQVLDSPVLPDSAAGKQFGDYRNHLQRLTLKIAIKDGLFPTALIIAGVELSSFNEYSSGAFADVYQGTYNGSRIAIKKIRVPAIAKEEEIQRIMQASKQYLT